MDWDARNQVLVDVGHWSDLAVTFKCHPTGGNKKTLKSYFFMIIVVFFKF